MIEQYIYSRADGQNRGSGNGVTFGFGLTHFTPGIAEIKQSVSDISYYVNTECGANGEKLGITSKRCLPRMPDRICLQHSVELPTRPRPTPVIHGYVGKTDDPSGWAINPDLWFSLPFFTGDPNVESVDLQPQESVSYEPTPLMPLYQVLERAGLAPQNFVTAVLAAFDVCGIRDMILLRLDYSAADAQETGEQLIRWIYHFLPFSLRRRAGFTTCFDDNAIGGDFDIALIPASVVEDRGGRVNIRTRRGYRIGAGYLFAGDTVQHSVSQQKKEFAGGGSIFARWLTAVISECCRDPAQQGELLASLEGFYAFADQLLGPERITPECFDMTCWLMLTSGHYTGQHIERADSVVGSDTGDELSFYEVLAECGAPAVVAPMLPKILLKSLMACRQNDRPESWVHVLSLFDPEHANPAVKQIMSMFFAAAIDAAGQGFVRETTVNYLAQCGLTEEIAPETGIMQSVMFPQPGEYQNLWSASGIDLSEEANARRRLRWAKEYISGSDNFQDFCDGLEALARQLAVFEPENAECVLAQLMEPAGNFGLKRAAAAGLSGLAAAAAEPEKITALLGFSSPSLDGFFSGAADMLYQPAAQRLAEKNIPDAGEECLRAFVPVHTVPAAAAVLAKLLGSITGRIDSLQDKSETLALLPPAENLYARVARLTNAMLMIGTEEDRMRAKQFYVRSLNIMAAEPGCYFSLSLLQNWEGQMPFPMAELSSNGKFNGAVLMHILSEFQRSTRYSLAAFVQVLRAAVPAENCKKAEYLCLRALYSMFIAGRWTDLGVELVDYCFTVCRKHDAEMPRQEYIFAIVRYQGVKALSKLLLMYPTQYGRCREFEPVLRPEKYNWITWMQADRSLADALYALALDVDLLHQWSDGDENAIPDLINAVDILFQDGCEMRNYARQINTHLAQVWETSSGLKNESARNMRLLRKNGAFLD